jgi:hypothetical protein
VQGVAADPSRTRKEPPMIPAFFRRMSRFGILPRLAVLAVVLASSAVPLAAQSSSTPAAPQTSPPPQAADLQGPSVAELARLVAVQGRALEEQRQALEAQQREIEDLRKKLDDTQKLSLSAHNRLEAMANAAPAPTADVAVEDRLAKIEQALHQIPDMPAEVVSAGSFPGSIAIPGTDAALRIAGLVRTTAVASLGPLGTEDRFVTSSIPVQGSPDAGKESRFVLTAVPSRFNLDVRTPTGLGAMRAFIEGDFAGGSSQAYRLRHAYGQWKGLVVGQTWSTFADPDAEPDGIDFEGLNAIALFRQTQVRYTRSFTERIDFAAALENPAPSITNAKGVSQVPDLVFRARWRPGRDAKGILGIGLGTFRKDSHVNLALLVRQIRGEPLDSPNTTRATGGFGVGLSGRLGSRWQPEKGQVMFSFYAGDGIGRYITDLGTLGGQDAVYDSASDKIEALPVFAWYLGYEARWNARWRSTYTYGTVIVSNLAVQPSDAFRQTNRGSFNVTYSPVRRLDLVAEYLFGNRVNKDGKQGFSSQIQLGTNFRF